MAPTRRPLESQSPHPFRALLEEAIADAGPKQKSALRRFDERAPTRDSQRVPTRPSRSGAATSSAASSAPASSAPASSAAASSAAARSGSARNHTPQDVSVASTLRDHSYVATEPTRKRTFPKPAPAPLEITLNLPSIGTLGDLGTSPPTSNQRASHAQSDDAPTTNGISRSARDDVETDLDLEDAIGAAIAHASRFDSDDDDEGVRISLPRSIAAGTDLYRAVGDAPSPREERPLARRFDEITNRISPFDPSTQHPDTDEHAVIPEEVSGLDDVATANGDDVLDRLIAKVREERAFADGHPTPSSASIDLDDMPLRDDDSDVSGALVMSVDRKFSQSNAAKAHDDAREESIPPYELETQPGRLNLSRPQSSAEVDALLDEMNDGADHDDSERPAKAARPFASMLAESLGLVAIEPPPEFSLDDVDGLGQLAPHRSEANNELADLADLAPEILEPVGAFDDRSFDDSRSMRRDLLPVSVGTPTCHWRLDAMGRPQLAAVSLSEGSRPLPLDELTDGVDSGRIALDQLGLSEDEFEPLREASDSFRVLKAQRDTPSENARVPKSIDFAAADSSDAITNGHRAEEALDDDDLDDSVLADVSLSISTHIPLQIGRVDVEREETLPPDGFGYSGLHLVPNIQRRPAQVPRAIVPQAPVLDVAAAKVAPNGEDVFGDDSLLEMSFSDLSFSELSLSEPFADDGTRPTLAPATVDSEQPRAFATATEEAGEDSAISTQDLAMPPAQTPALDPAITTIPLRESMAHLKALQTPRVRAPLSRLTVEGKPVSEAARVESVVPPMSVRPSMTPPDRVPRPRDVGPDGDRLRKGHDLYLLALQKIDAGRMSEALLNVKLATAYDPSNSGYRELTTYLGELADGRRTPIARAFA